MIKVMHDPSNGPLAGVITWRPETPTIVDFRAQAAERCGRCNRELPVHVWQLVDTDPVEEALVMQRGVVDCGIVEAAA